LRTLPNAILAPHAAGHRHWRLWLE
jgi:hypothetical protein